MLFQTSFPALLTAIAVFFLMENAVLSLFPRETYHFRPLSRQYMPFSSPFPKLFPATMVYSSRKMPFYASFLALLLSSKVCFPLKMSFQTAFPTLLAIITVHPQRETSFQASFPALPTYIMHTNELIYPSNA